MLLPWKPMSGSASLAPAAPGVAVTSTADWVARINAAFFFPPGLGGFGAQHGRVSKVAPGLIDHHQLHP